MKKIDLIKGVSAEIVSELYDDERFSGMIINGGEELSDEETYELVDGSYSDKIWETLEKVGYIKANLNRYFLEEAATLSNNFMPVQSNRRTLNALPHSDLSSMLITANSDRRQKTGLYPVNKISVEIIFEEINKLVAKKSEILIEINKEHLDIALRAIKQYGYKAFGESSFLTLFSDVIQDLCESREVSEDDLFELNKSIHNRLVEAGCGESQDWLEYNSLWISRWIFHQRVCDVVNDISETNQKTKVRTSPIDDECHSVVMNPYDGCFYYKFDFDKFKKLYNWELS